MMDVFPTPRSPMTNTLNNSSCCMAAALQEEQPPQYNEENLDTESKKNNYWTS